MLNIGLIGLGTVSIVHLRAIKELEQSNLVAICDIDETKRNEEPEKAFYTDLDEMLANENLDVVHICLPHHSHDEAVKKCIDAGVNVMLEKPVSINYKRSYRLALKVAEKPGVKVGVCFQNRLNKTVIDLKQILKEEDSDILAIKGEVPWYRPLEYYSQKPWRGIAEEAGGGSIINQGIHTLDLLRYITDSNWMDCRALIGNLLDYDIDVDDTAVAHFNLENNIRAFYHSTNAYYGNDSVGIQVVTNRGTYNIKDNKLYDINNRQLSEDAMLPGTKIYYGPGHQDCIEQFYEAIIHNTDDYVKLADANITMEMVEAIKQSANGKRITREDIIYG